MGYEAAHQQFIRVSSVDLSFLLWLNLRAMAATRATRDPHGKIDLGCAF